MIQAGSSDRRISVLLSLDRGTAENPPNTPTGDIEAVLALPTPTIQRQQPPYAESTTARPEDRLPNMETIQTLILRGDKALLTVRG
jgi:hypothetical protein